MWDLATSPSLADEMLLAVSIIDVSCGAPRLSYCNQAWEELTGYSRIDSLGQPFRFPSAPCDDDSVERLHRAMETGSACTVRVRDFRRNGALYSSELHLVPLRGATQSVTHFLCEHRDVTELVRAERSLRLVDHRLRQITALLTEGVFHRDPTGRLLYANPAYLDLTGLDDTECSLEAFLQRVAPDDQRHVLGWHSAACSGTKGEVHFRVRDLRGQLQWRVGRAAPFWNAAGDPEGAVGVISDVGAAMPAD